MSALSMTIENLSVLALSLSKKCACKFWGFPCAHMCVLKKCVMNAYCTLRFPGVIGCIGGTDTHKDYESGSLL